MELHLSAAQLCVITVTQLTFLVAALGHGNTTRGILRISLGFFAIRDIQMSGKKNSWLPLYSSQQCL